MKSSLSIKPTTEQGNEMWDTARDCMARSVARLTDKNGMAPVSGMCLMVGYGITALTDLDAVAAKSYFIATIEALEFKGTARADAAEEARALAFEQLSIAAQMRTASYGGDAG